MDLGLRPSTVGIIASTSLLHGTCAEKGVFSVGVIDSVIYSGTTSKKIMKALLIR